MTPERENSNEHASIAHSLKCTAQNLAARILESANGKNSPFLIAIGGFTTLGKSTLAKNIAALLPEATILATDGFITLSRAQILEQGLLTADHPETTDFAALNKTIRDLSRGQTVEISRFNHAPGEIEMGETIIPSGQFIIVDGVTSLYPELAISFDLRIFLDGNFQTRFSLRRTVSLNERGYSEEQFAKTWPRFLNAYERFIKKSGSMADITCLVDENRRFRSSIITSCMCPLMP